MSVQPKPLSEVAQEAIDLLSKEMGGVNTVRFLNQFRTGYGDYTQERESLLKGVTVNEVVEEARKLRHEGAGLRPVRAAVSP